VANAIHKHEAASMDEITRRLEPREGINGLSLSHARN